MIYDLLVRQIARKEKFTKAEAEGLQNKLHVLEKQKEYLRKNIKN